MNSVWQCWITDMKHNNFELVYFSFWHCTCPCQPVSLREMLPLTTHKDSYAIPYSMVTTIVVKVIYFYRVVTLIPWRSYRVTPIKLTEQVLQGNSATSKDLGAELLLYSYPVPLQYLWSKVLNWDIQILLCIKEHSRVLAILTLVIYASQTCTASTWLIFQRGF